ncbi:MAG: flagellar basal body-associated FliL family protein, partial [Paracoccaceae bacterium]
MAEADLPQDAVSKKKSKLPLILGLVLAVVAGAAGFLATWSGMLFAPAEEAAHGEDPHAAPLPDIAFVPIEPLVISLGEASEAAHLRFTAQLEVGSSYAAEVTHLLPRILDVLNGYLRAVEVSELEDPSALVRLRAQMLRRIQIVAGEGRVRDLLVTEFVL